MSASESTDAVYAEMMVLARRLRRQSGLNHPALTVTDYSILSHLVHHGGGTVTDTAAEFGLNKSTASRQLAGLIQRHLVERVTDPDDGRVVHLRPTEAGLQALDDARAELRRNLIARLDGWAVTEIDLFAALLRRYNTTVSR